MKNSVRYLNHRDAQLEAIRVEVEEQERKQLES
jgi:hypothetical protein